MTTNSKDTDTTTPDTERPLHSPNWKGGRSSNLGFRVTPNIVDILSTHAQDLGISYTDLFLKMLLKETQASHQVQPGRVHAPDVNWGGKRTRNLNFRVTPSIADIFRTHAQDLGISYTDLFLKMLLKET